MSKPEFLINEEQAKGFFAACRRRLPDMKKKLSRVIHDREDIFLQLGGQVQGFALKATDLAANAVNLTEQTSDEAIGHYTSLLSKDLDLMNVQCETSSNRSDIDDLNKIIDMIDKLNDLIQEYQRIVRQLQMLGISTRIESARLSSYGKGFSTLADDVEKLAHNIVNYTSQIFERTSNLHTLSTEAAGQTNIMLENQQSCSSTIMFGIRDHLDSFINLEEKSKESSMKLATQTSEISSNIGDVVSSLQFHDITRQQIEHVNEAIDDILELLNEQNSSDDRSPLEIISWIGDVCALQASQVGNAKDRFYNAVETVKTKLDDIVNNISNAATHMQQIIGLDNEQQGGDESRVLMSIEKGVSGVIGSMRDFSKQGEDIGAVMTSVAQTVADISSFLGDIEEVGAEIKLIALNASIKAAHTGDKGKALGVLAMSVQQLSQKAGELTQSTSEILETISQAADSLAANAESYKDTTELDSLVESLETVISGLVDLDKSTMSLFQDMDQGSTELAQGIADMIQEVDFHYDVSNELEEFKVMFDDFSTSARELVPISQDQNRSERLKEMLERYTMEAERLVHQTAFNESDSDDVDLFGDMPAADSSGGDDSWDNIELF